MRSWWSVKARMPLPIKAQAGKSSASCKPNAPAKLEIVKRPMRNPDAAMMARRVSPREVGKPLILPTTETYDGGIGATPKPNIA